MLFHWLIHILNDGPDMVYKILKKGKESKDYRRKWTKIFKNKNVSIYIVH